MVIDRIPNPNTSNSSINITDNQISKNSNILSENISGKHHNPYYKVNFNPKDIHDKYRNNGANKSVGVEGQFRVYHQNIRGLRGKVTELLLSVLDEAPHIICLTEHHLKDYEIDITHIPKYKLGSKYCRQNLKNGGVSIYIQDTLTYSNINLLKYNKEQDIEICAIQLNTQVNTVIILCLYRAPSGNFENFLNMLDKILYSLYKPKNEFIICGDININYMETSNNKKQLDNLLATYNVTSTVYFPTRIVDNSISMIDNIFIDISRNYTIKPLINGLSDHDAQIISIFNFFVPMTNTDPNHIRIINKKAISEFQLQLSWERWEDVFGSKDVNAMFNNFLNTYLRYYYTNFIKKEMKHQHINKQWITKGIRNSCNRKKELFLLCRINNNPNLKKYYKKYCKVLARVIRAAKYTHYNKVILNSKNKIKSTWKIINEEKGKSNPRSDIKFLKKGNNIISNQEEMATIFNNYFLSVADLINKDNKGYDNNTKLGHYLWKHPTKPINKMHWKYASTYEIEKIIKSLNSKNSHGYEGISNKIIKLSSPFIISPVTYICNEILKTGRFPDRLKYAIVKPIFKKGDKHETSNYRPISLLTSFSKIMEKLIFNRLFSHFEKNNILANEQFGFRPHSSTEQAAYVMINGILSALNDKSMVGGIFCDLQKAFDCVNHELLMEKLEFYGVNGKFKSLLKSYLTKRFQKVTLGNMFVNGKSSNWKLIKNGVPQGSILGPLLFLIYINDLPKILNKENKMVLFADDTSILITDSDKMDFEHNIKQTFQDINAWFLNNRLSLNANKTQFVKFRTNHYSNIIHYAYDIKGITTSNEAKFLGLMLDNTLSWKLHIDQLVGKLCSACYALRNIKSVVSQDSLKIIYFAHIHSLLSYGIIFWGNSSYSKKVFLIQKKSIRIITNSKPKDSCRKLFINLKIMTMYSQYIYSTVLHTVSNKHLFTFNSEIHKHRTRYNSDLHLPIANLTKYTEGPYFSAIKIFNHLPDYIKSLVSEQKRFKYALKEFLLQHSFYSIQEYYDFKHDT
jgi:exonuclease III